MSEPVAIDEIRINPDVEISEELIPDLSDVKINQRVQVILNFDVIEKTKSFVMLRISSVYRLPTARKF